MLCYTFASLLILIFTQFCFRLTHSLIFQVYKGLDIITNKVTKEERRLAPHHLLDFVDPLEDFNVSQFQCLALDAITKLHERGKLPIVVGGTHYYIESVLWKILIDKLNNEKAPSTTISKTGDGSDQCNTDHFGKESDHISSHCSVNSDDASIRNEKVKVPVVPLVTEDSPKEPRPEDYTRASEQVTENDTVRAECARHSAKAVADDEAWRNEQATATTEDLYKELISSDPARASSLHPRDRRKIIR